LETLKSEKPKKYFYRLKIELHKNMERTTVAMLPVTPLPSPPIAPSVLHERQFFMMLTQAKKGRRTTSLKNIKMKVF
jgi:hypothetical protein